VNDPYATEAARLRAIVQTHLREGSEPTLTPYEQFVLVGWYERELVRMATDAEEELARVVAERNLLAGNVDRNYAARLQEERHRLAAVEALDRATTGAAGWDERTATRLDDADDGRPRRPGAGP
jgi:hypothetical protein